MEWSALLEGIGALATGDPTHRRRGRIEAAVEETFGSLAACLVDSGTTALRLALEGARQGQRPVAIPAYSCYDIATAVEGADVPVVVYDVDPRTLAPDWQSLAALADSRPAAVVVCHLFGHLVDVGRVRDVLGDVPVIEDAAQGVAGRLGGRRLGTLGALSVLSFGRGKGLTGGGGGALLGNDDWGRGIVARARESLETSPPSRGVASMVALAAQMLLGRPSLYGVPAALPFLHLGETRYHPPHPSEPATAGSLAVLRRVLANVDRDLATRVEHAHRLERALADSPRAWAMERVEGAEPGYLRLPALLKSEADASTAAAARWGVARGYPRPLTELPVLARRRVEPLIETPGARELAGRLVTLPTHAFVKSRDLTAIEHWLATPRS